MAYTAEISRNNPTLFVFLVDQSGSMSDKVSLGTINQSKSSIVADTINRLLQNLALRSAKEEGVRDYFHVSVIGYGQHGAAPALGGMLAGRDVVPLSEVADNPVRIDERRIKVPDGAGSLVEQTIKLPIWLDATANGGTPMVAALTKAQRIVEEFLESHPYSFPPVVLNVSDGESTDGQPSAAGQGVRALSSADGGVLLFNLHISSTSAAPVLFPSSDAALPDQWARLLFEMSSVLPPHMLSYAVDQQMPVGDGARGFVFNADPVSLVQFFDIGTRVAIELR